MLGRLATYVVPAASVTVTALVLFGPGSPNPAPFVRVRGVPVAGGQTLALRLEGARRLFGVDDVAALEGVTVEVTDAGANLAPRAVSLGPDGVGEASVEKNAPLTGPLDVRVLQGNTVLVEGTVPLRPTEPPRLGRPPVQGVATGDLRISVVVPRGQLAAPFPEAIQVRVREPDDLPLLPGRVPPITIKASASGATIEPPNVNLRDPRPATFTVTPLAHLVELILVANDHRGNEGRWEGLLPVRPGAIWLDPDLHAGLTFVSPAPRDRVYASIVTDAGRILGAIVPVTRDDAGFFRGRLDVKLPKEPAQIILSGDPGERGDATTAWPLAPHAASAAAPRLELLLDGSAAAEAREHARASSARRAAVFLVAIAALAEVLLILVRTRASQRDLDANLAAAVSLEASDEAGAPIPSEDQRRIVEAARDRHPALRVALVITLVVLGFALFAALSTFRR
ncbi:hypothetical protein [Polyangium jinanense]|uniref:Uncharacterized protein n=1 Tax=Polyangium jinanense TaxID=2829994 RepID=A0A9X3XFM1_9BACT|nr:hypothetical protein [Polyangium jinanense]MDC3956843.1 hypothetical protein [Polyangium jinanense]MDC3957686.1 hypothetical protein [Polyangium jinanense]MDC3987106.1 hypothetical protein [Polyangium jinanense]